MAETTRLERASQVVRGERSELRAADGRISLTKQATTQARPTTIEVEVGRLRGCTLERPTRGRRGWLHLAVVDGSPAPVSELAAASDPYALPITSRQLPAARKLVRWITDHVQRRGLPHEGDGHRLSSGVVVDPQPAVDGGSAPATAEASPDAGEASRATEPATPAAGEATPPGPGISQASQHPPPPPVSTRVSREELTEQLRQLAELHDAGALSNEEFDRAKRQVLGQ